MEDKLLGLYNDFKNAGLFKDTKDYGTFRQRMQGQGYQAQIYKVAKQNGADVGQFWQFQRNFGLGRWAGGSRQSAQTTKHLTTAQRANMVAQEYKKNLQQKSDAYKEGANFVQSNGYEGESLGDLIGDAWEGVKSVGRKVGDYFDNIGKGIKTTSQGAAPARQIDPSFGAKPSASTNQVVKKWELLNKRPDQMTTLEMSQASNMREQSRKVRERYVAEQKKRATPISSSKIVPSAKSFDELMLDFDTPEARMARAKQQHEDDINQMAYQGVGQNLGKDIFAMTDKAIDLAEQSSKDFFKGAEDALGFSRQYDPRIQKSIADAADMRKSTETIQRGLQIGLADKVQEYFSRPEIQKNVMDTAEKMNISLEEAVQKYYMPNLMQYAKDAVEQRQLEKVLPQSYFDYLGKNLSNNIVGMMLSNGRYSKEERQRRQRALAISEGFEEAPQMVGHETKYYKAGILARASGTGLNMLADSPFFGVGGTAADMAVNAGSRILARGLEKVGLKTIGKVLTPREMAFKAANMSMAQKMMSGLTTGTAKSALNLGGYSSITGGLQQISTGEDSSPAAVAMAAITSGWHGAKTGAMFGLSGGVMHPWASRYGITGLERNAEQRFIHGAQKVGATAASVGVEAGTMMVADHLQDDKEMSFAQWLEDGVTVMAFKLGEPRNYKHVGSILHGLTHNTSKTPITLTKDEKSELINSVSGKNLMDAFLDVSKASRKSPMYKSVYKDFMADPEVSRSTKEKVNAALGMPSQNYKISQRSVNDVKNKQILEYASDGTLLTRTSYKNAEERRDILYRQKADRDNMYILNLVGIAKLRGRQLVDDNGKVSRVAADFLQEKGYDISKDPTDPKNAELIANLQNPNHELYLDWIKYADERNQFTGVDTSINKILEKQPLKRTDEEVTKLKEYAKSLETQLFPDNKLHTEESRNQGRRAAEDNNLGTEQPNGDAVKQELNGLRQAEEEVEVLMRDNDVFSQNFKKLQSQGLTNPQIYDWMVQQGGLTVEQLEPFAHYINANARVQGMQEATKQKLENVASSFVQDWSYKDTLNGVGMVNADGSAETVLFVYHDGKELIVGSGDVSFNQPNEYGIRRAKEDVGDMLVCFDPQTGQMVYVHASEVDYSREMKPEELKAQKILELQNINSVPYNEATQEQAMQDAAENQDQSESGKGNDASETPEIVSEATPVETPTDFSFNNGKGRIKSYKVTPHEKTKSDGTKEITFSSEVTFTKGASKVHKEGEVINIGNGGGFIKIDPIDIDYQQYAVSGRLHDDGTAFSKDEATSEDIAEAKEQIDTLLTPQLAEEMGPQYNVNKIIIAPDGRVFAKFKGMDGNIPMKRNPLEKAPQDNTTLTKVDTTSGKDNTTNEDLAPQEQPQPIRKFADGTEVPMTTDSKGRPTPDYGKMTPEQSAEILTEDFGENAEKVVDGQIQKAEKALKDAEKMKVDYTAEPNDIMEQEALKKKTVEAAKKQLEHAQNIKKVMTAKKVAETVGKTEQTEGAHEAGSVAAQKFVNAPRLVGNKRTRMLPDGETKIRGHYEIVPAESLTPSHDVNNGYKKSEGFPTDAEGRTVNDRDYEHDKAAQQNTDQIARKYNGMAIEQVPVVSDEGIVYDGNGRTMAGQKAAKEGTDGEYINDLLENAENFGFTREQIEQSGIEHPRLVLVTDERLPYDTATFAKFNRNEKKTQSNTEQAVAKAKTLTSDEVGSIVAEIDGNGSLEAFFNNSKAINDLVKTLVDKGIIGQNEVAQMMDSPERLSAQGREYVKNLLLGSIFKPETIRMLGIDSTVKNKAINAIRSVMDNMKLGEFSLRDEIDQAIQLLYEARQGGNKVDTLLRTSEMFGEDAAKRYPSISQMMALALEGKVADFRDLLDEYNRIAKARNTGEGNMFEAAPTKEELIKEFLDFKKWQDYGTGHSENEGGNDVSGVEEPQQKASGGNEPAEAERPRVEEPDDLVNKELESRIEVTDEETETPSKNGPIMKQKIVIDGDKEVIKVDEPNENGEYTGSYYEYDGKKFGDLNEVTEYIDGKQAEGGLPLLPKEEKPDPNFNPIEAAADAFHEEQKQKGEFAMNLKIGKARQDYAAAKESGDAERTTKAAKELKHLLDDRLKQEGKGLAERQKIIAEEIGKAEADIIDKPWEQMDLEEREAVSSKNPLTESEINELTSDENKELIPAALAYLRGDKSNIINAISYFKIWNDVRNRHENVSDNSGTENGTQLDAADTTGGEGLGLGRGRESGRPDGPVDRGTGNAAAPGERNGGESNQNDTTLSAGEQGNKQGEGNSSGVGAVPAGSSDTNGGGSAGGNGNVSGGSGRESSNRPADTNAGRKPAAKQGTTFPDSTAERLKQERADYEKKKKDFWARWKKAGQGYAKIALTPFKKLNLTPEQIEMLPELFKMHLNGAVLKIKEGIYKFNEWKAAMLAEEGEELKMIGLSDDDIDRFIEDYWNTPYEMDGETHTIREWSSIYGNQQLKKKLKEPLEEKYKRQMEAEPIEVKVGDMKNIEETLPYLLPQQQEDVLKAETQFFGKEHTDREHAYGKGYLFTNGTGTGKTYTGLGIAKRLAKQGKGRILFITPSQKKVSDWIKDGKNLGLDIKDLDSWAKMRGTTATTESGEGMVITTFANFGLNKKLLETEWDAVIYDECHRIMENKKGTETARSMQHYMITNRDENHCFRRLQSINPEYQKMNTSADKFNALRQKEIDRIKKEYKDSHPSATDKDVVNATLKSLPRDLNSFAPADGMTFPKLGKAYQDFIKARDTYNKVEPKLKEQAKDSWKNTKTIFLSATPFNTRENLDYVEGYIFKYPETDERGMAGRTQFYLNHFGAAYKFRYHRLEQSISNPDAVAKQEVAFSDYLQNTLGTMSGRIIDSPYDYSRDFPTVAPDHADDFNNAVQDTLKTKYLHDAYSKTIGDYNYGSALFETMKVSAAIDRIKQHLDLGRKVVIFHRRVESKEPLEAPFAYMLRVANEQIKMMKPGKERNEYIKECTEFRNKYADLLEWEKTLDYSMPREQIAKVFGEKNVLFFSGKESKKVKDKAVDTFNDDDSGKNIIVIQEASGKEGISLHDTTSKHQRVCITLALPQSPITALQIEGRIYRIGNMSNAIFEYPILGLNSEMMLFGEKFNNQVSTTENLALGSQARNLRDSFANGILEHSGIVPVENQGVGGKEFDAATPSENDPFDNAVLDYYSNQKLNKNNREGSDYFPTPEPLGYKMVEWAGLGEGDSVLEPSAGHGAIARYVPKTNEMVSIEPSQSLFTKLQLKAGGLGRKFLNNTFENYALNNKHDVIVMNPPFGKAGALAIQHVDKAFKHLDEGGRIVAIIPRGSTDKKFDKWYNEQKNVAMRAEVNLPDILFQQAGTRVACRVVVLDKISDAALRSKAGYPEKIDLSGHYDKIEDFFNDLRDIEMPERIIDTNLKMQKKAKAAVKDIMEIKGVKNVSYGKTGIDVSLTGSWMNYGISFTGSDKPNYWRDKMANYYTKYDELQKLEYQENKQAVFDELKKLSCKLAGMTEDEMQRYISNRQENGKTHFRIEENAENEGSSEKLFLSLQKKSNNKKEYNETVTELANRVKQGTARIAGEIEEGSRRGSSPNYGGLPAIAGKILNGAYKQGRGQSGEMAGGASDRKGEEVLSSDFVYAQIEDWAKENKCYFTEEDIAKGSLDGEAWKNGAEAYVYRSKDGKSAIKVMPFDPYYKNPVDYYLDRNRYFNDVFPDTAIEVMGYGRDNNGKFSIFYKQPLIEGKTVIEHFNGDGEKANEYIDNMLANMGYNKKVPHDEWGCMSDSNGKYNIFDVNYSNVIIGKDGKPHVIDAEVLPVDYKNDGKTEIKDNDSETHFRNDNESPVSISKDAPAVVKHVAKVAKATGGKVKMLQSVEEVTNAEAKARLEKGEKVEGWYDERTGEVVLYMPNIHDRYTAEKTIWHEVVGHKGMRELFGDERFDKFLRDVWYDLDKPENADLKKLVDEERKFNPLNIYDAIEEGIARLAEDGKGEAGFWNGIKNKVSDFLHEIGYRIAPNTKDVKYLLWLSKNLQKNPNDPYWKMRAEAVKYRLDHERMPAVVAHDGMFYGNDGKVRSMDSLTKSEWDEATDGQIHFRTTPSAGTALDRYHRSLDEHGYMFTESYMDNMLSLKKLMNAIVPDKKIEDIASSENPYILQNTMQGAMSDAAQMFERNVMKPLDKAMADVLDAFDGKKDDEKIRNFNLYMITKHGLERNRVFFVRDFLRQMRMDEQKKQDADFLENSYYSDKEYLDNELKAGNIDLKEYYRKLDESIRNHFDADFEAGEHDYSGMHAIQEVAKSSDPYDDAEAIQSVMDSEAKMESIKKGAVKDYWDKVKAATQYSIDSDYKNGIISKELHGHVSNMFNWYVPLRKYDEATAEDTYGYITEQGDPKSYIGSTIMRARGHKYLSETNVLAQIGAMGNRAIKNGGMNAIRQAFARFARNNSGNNLITETSVWYEKDPVVNIVYERYPDIPEDATADEINQIVSDFNKDMKMKESQGLAYKVYRRDKIGYKFQRAENKSQHIVDVKIAGRTHTFIINGNPRAAQALNGLLEHKNDTLAGRVAASISRKMAQLCTSFNPEFVMRNMIKDFEFASTNLLAKEGLVYTKRFEQYYAKVGIIEGIRNSKLKDFADTGGFGLYAKYRNGTLDTTNKLHRYFKEFMENGGETGWVQIKNMEDFTKEYKLHIKGERKKVQKVGKGIYNAIFKNLENVNEIAENLARFATYCASRDSNRSIIRSVYDAKEVSTNFNRHGSGNAVYSFKNGEMGTGKTARKNIYGFTAAWFRNSSMFFNAGIQSTNLLIKNFKNNKAGTIGYIASAPFISGMAMALLNNFIISNEDEKDRKGVKDPYAELPDYIRRNNLCIYIGGGEFVTIPLAIEERAFYGLGDFAAGMTFSKNISSQKMPNLTENKDIDKYLNPFMDAVGCMSQLVPVADYLGNASFGKHPVQETIKAVAPSATSPFLEWVYNSDWKGAPIQRDNKFDENQPSWMLAYKGTSEWMINMNKKVNALTNDVAPGNEDMKGNDFLDEVTNPSALHHFYGSYLGGAATFVERVAGLIKNGKNTETKDIPFLRSLLYTPNEQSSLQRTKSKWYNYKDEMEKTMANVDRLKSKNVPLDKRITNIGEYYQFQNSKEAAKVRVIELAEKQMERWKKIRDKASDTESINFANQNIDRIMMDAVDELDRLE